jgi:hypothetical protein
MLSRIACRDVEPCDAPRKHVKHQSPCPSSIIQCWQRVHPYRNTCFSSVETSTGPDPIRGLFHQTATHGIIVNVVNHLKQSGRLYDIAVVASATLPKTIVIRTIRLHILQAFKKTGSPPTQEPAGMSGNWDLQARSDAADLVFRVFGVHNDVHVFGHDDVCPDREMKITPSRFHRIDKPATCSIFAQERKALKAGKREFVGISWCVEALYFLSMNGHLTASANLNGGRSRRLACFRGAIAGFTAPPREPRKHGTRIAS